MRPESPPFIGVVALAALANAACLIRPDTDAGLYDVAPFDCGDPHLDVADVPASPCEVPLTPTDPALSTNSPAPPAPVCATTPYDAIVILGSPANLDGTPSDDNLLRVNLALRAQCIGLGDRFIVTGAAVHNQWVEADVLRNLLVSYGVSPEAIYEDRLAEHTDENIYYSTQIMIAHGWTTALIVSDIGHLRFTAECDSNCCVQLGRATILDFGGAPPLQLMRYQLFPAADPIQSWECPLLERRLQCVNLDQRRSCLGRLMLPDSGM